MDGKTSESRVYLNANPRTLNEMKWNKMFDANCKMLRKNKSALSIWIFYAKAAFSLSLFRLQCHFMSCIFIRASTFTLAHFLSCSFSPSTATFLLGACTIVTLFNLRIQQRVFHSLQLFFFLYLLSMATSAESYHSKSKHFTHSFKRLLKTLKREQNVLFVLHFLV